MNKELENEEALCTEGYEHNCLHARNSISECTCNCGGTNHGKGLKPVTSEQQAEVIRKILEDKDE